MNPEESKSLEEWQNLGEKKLAQHIRMKAEYVAQAYPDPKYSDIEKLLQDMTCLRFLTKIQFEFGNMAGHQLAQPIVYGGGNPTCLLYIHPALEDHIEQLIPLILFFIPVINYGETVIKDSHCLLFASTALGVQEEAVYQNLCALAEKLNLEHRMQQ